MTKAIQSKIEELRKEIRFHDQKYYVEARPVISDLDYDRLMKQLQSLEEDHPELVTSDSPTQRVGESPVPHLEQVEHTVPMLSIDNSYEIEEFVKFGEKTEDWMDSFRSSTNNKLCSTVLWIDGLFGDKHRFDDRSFSGKISLGFREDETEGSDPRLRVRIKARLPNVSSRLNAFIGRVEEDSYISNTEVDRDQVNAVGLRSVDDDDDE